QRGNAQRTDVVITSDTTATVHDVARLILDADPPREIGAAPEDVLTLSVAPPSGTELSMLAPNRRISDTPAGSGFIASIINLGADYQPTRAVGAPATAILAAVSGPVAGLEFPLPRGHFTVGRAPDNDIVLDDPLISKRHARIEVG